VEQLIKLSSVNKDKAMEDKLNQGMQSRMYISVGVQMMREKVEEVKDCFEWDLN